MASELVASLSETKDVAKLVPLYLEGGALALYLEMDAAKRADYNLLSQELILLIRAYSDSELVAYSKLRTVKWTGEPVDVFANDIQKLARGCGLKGDGLEQVVKLAFIHLQGFRTILPLSYNKFRMLRKCQWVMC